RDARADDRHHRASVVDDRARRSHRGARRRPAGRGRDARRAGRELGALPRDRGQGPARARLPDARAGARGGGPVRSGRLRKLRGLAALLRPYRARVYVMLVALVLAIAASLAPPYLAGRAVDDGIRKGDLGGLTLIGTAVILVVLDPKLALVTFAVFPVLGGASLLFRIKSAGAYRATREKLAAVTAYLQETISGVRIVRAFGQEDRHKNRLAE